MEDHSFIIGLFPLNIDDFLHCLVDVELADVLSKFVSFDLSIIKQILNGKLHKVDRQFLGLNVVTELFHSQFKIRD